MNKIKKSGGYSLFEMLIVVTIMMTVATITIKQKTDELRNIEASHFANQIDELLNAVSERVIIQGLNSNKWVDGDGNAENNWYPDTLDDNAVYNFISTQLYAKGHNCHIEQGGPLDGYWDYSGKNGFSNCSFMKMFPFEVDAFIEIEEQRFGGRDAISSFGIVFVLTKNDYNNYKEVDEETFENILRTYYYFRDLKAVKPTGVARVKIYGLNDSSPTSLQGCAEKYKDSVTDMCLIKFELAFNVSDNSEYLMVSGANRMRGSITFAPNPEDNLDKAKLDSCFVWRFDTLNNLWYNLEVEDEDGNPTLQVPCGIAYHAEEELDSLGQPVDDGDYNQVVSFVGHDGSFENSISLNRDCAASDFNIPSFTKERGAILEDTVNPNMYEAGLETFKCGLFRTNQSASPTVIALVNDVFADKLHANVITTGKLFINDSVSFNNSTDQFIMDSDGFFVRSGPESTDATFDSTNSKISFHGAVVMNSGVYTTKDMKDALLVADNEYVTKGYVDKFGGAGATGETGPYYIAFAKNLQRGNLVRELSSESDLPYTGPYSHYVRCAPDYTREVVVGPTITHGYLNNTIYAMSPYAGLPNHYEVVITPGPLEESPWANPEPTNPSHPNNINQPWASVMILCKKVGY